MAAAAPIDNGMRDVDSPTGILPPPAPVTESTEESPSLTTSSIVRDGVIDMRLLMLSLWKHRKNAAFTNALCDELRRLTSTRPILDQVDFYLPQLSHMVLHLEKELPMEAMEQFVMLLSLSSSHFAFEFFWIIYGALDEHRPKKNGNPRTFARCAQLLMILEQCFIYGSPVNKQAKELFASQRISKEEMDLILKADRRFFAAQSSANMTLLEDSFEGWLYKKGGGTRKLGRRSWHRRWCRIERKMLLIYNNRSDQYARNAIALERAEVRVLSNPKRQHYFEIHHSFSGTTFKFAAPTNDDLMSWVDNLEMAVAPPCAPPSSPSKVGPSRAMERMSAKMRSFILEPEREVHTSPSADKEHELSDAIPVEDSIESSDKSRASSSAKQTVQLTSEEQMRYDYFTDQINFVKSITDVCEELRLVDVAKRKELLPKKLETLNKSLPSFVYLPLCRSADKFYRVASICTNEGFVFKTHERAPCLLHFMTVPYEGNLDVSSALFAHLHAQDEDVESMKSDGTSLRDSNSFIEELLSEPSRKENLGQIFGEMRPQKIARIQQSSNIENFHLQSCIAKSYDDLRQEVLVMQLITYIDDVFRRENLGLQLHPYRILSTGSSTGLLEVVANSTSFDGLKKSPGFKSLKAHFESIYGDSTSLIYRQAMTNFVQSLAAYSIVCYVLCIKDRHNGNILIDIEGHVIHIDFGFFLGRAPGGSFSFETAPFKLTTEMVECMGGKESENFKTFCDLCTQAALAVRRHGETLYTLVEVMSFNSKLPCFIGNVAHTLSSFKERLFLNLKEEKVPEVVQGLIDKSLGNFGTTKYDQFQEYSNGIAK
ncbi:hypothetical protein Ae201684P_003368 [Aphanomyces euteiches]|uniref:1-phosphatidylinositol 4-kinase n=1 Tax=Aphanomyces euteiches TaxID=100861 RepID=A0A6G0WAS8_9STRA|nr:hypothetical protein Ae201684_017008 [Aphanomyces euteiches]KAH9073869.1 hypothetical protein Ae201684P_003368 [Aphanomyces euteiches]KAH9158060.1 hypothetical protein AeRB84_000195 [Aphanomyces euteiches]